MCAGNTGAQGLERAKPHVQYIVNESGGGAEWRPSNDETLETGPSGSAVTKA